MMMAMMMATTMMMMMMIHHGDNQDAVAVAAHLMDRSHQVWYGQWYGKQDPVAVKVVALCRDSITNELMLYARRASEDVSDHAATIEAEWEAIRLLPNHENIVTFHSVLWWRPDQVTAGDRERGRGRCLV